MRVGTLGSGARSCAGVRLAASSYCRACATDVQVADWWCQTVTVGYERIKGLRVGDARNVNLAAIRQEASRVSVWEDKIARPLRALHLDTLRNQILTFAVLATVLPMLTLYVVSFRQDRGALGDQLAPELTGASADAAVTTADSAGQFRETHVFWTPGPPAGPASALFARLAERGLLLEPFDRAGIGLREVYGDPLGARR